MFISYIVLAAFTLDAFNCNTYDTPTVGEDSRLDFEVLTREHAKPSVKHSVTTEDGYVLGMFNIPGDTSKVVLLIHGVFDSSDGHIIRGNQSLGIILAAQGYDVWFLNNRGNMYSRKHVSLDPNKNKEFWNFSANEYAIDLAAAIDYILNRTGQKALSIIGFSEGTTSTFILKSTRPEYNDKVKVFIAMAPVVFMEHVGPALSFIIGVSPLIDFFLPHSMQEIGSFFSISKEFINVLCTQLAISYEVCYEGGINSVSGNSVGIERDFFPTIVKHFPAGTSRKNLIHFAQISRRKTFAAYDYGLSTNMKVYKSMTPPQYNLSKVTTKTFLMSGPNDIVSTLEDVETLKKHLPNVMEHKIVNSSSFSHLDFMWGKQAVELVYGDILNILKKYA